LYDYHGHCAHLLLHLRQTTAIFCVNLMVASSVETSPSASFLDEVSAMRLLTFKIPEAPHGDHTTDAFSIWSFFS
jgi:hypothetical protein